MPFDEAPKPGEAGKRDEVPKSLFLAIGEECFKEQSSRPFPGAHHAYAVEGVSEPAVPNLGVIMQGRKQFLRVGWDRREVDSLYIGITKKRSLSAAAEKNPCLEPRGKDISG